MTGTPGRDHVEVLPLNLSQGRVKDNLELPLDTFSWR